ncbi:MAG: C39 family peptidase [Oscillospiraceae bacterium]|nr:C39 family peptidase [Oscillospiraceae bacterium]
MSTLRQKISVTMAAVMAVSVLGMLPAAAEEVVEYSTIEEYIEYAIPHYVRAQSVEINGTFYYSNTIDIYDINDIEGGSIGECVFLFDDDEIIGKMQVWQVDGEYASVFDTYITDEIQGSFDGDYAIALGYFEDDLYSYDEVVGSTFVDGAGFEECPDYELPLSESISKAASMDLAAIPAPYAASTSLAVPWVKNDICDNTHTEKHWLCWAACVAMMVNYSDETSLTTKDVWRSVKTSSNPDPDGALANIKSAFDNYDYSYYYQKNAISASEVLGALSNHKPVFIKIDGVSNSGKDVYHAIVICGISIDNASSSSANITYTVNDPTSGKNLSFLVTANPTNVVTAISYKPSGYKYNEWRYTIY